MNVNNNIKVVLDIDGVLSFCEDFPENEASFFKKRGMIISTCEGPNYVLPGVRELIQLFHRTKRISLAVFSLGFHRICFATGLFFTALREAERQGISISDALFREQFKEIYEDKYSPIFLELSRRDEFYVLGLEKLREVNPDYVFVTPNSYKAIVEKTND